MFKSIYFSALLLLLVFWSCSSTYTVTRDLNPTVFTTRIGTATSYDFKETVSRLLNRYQYDVVRFEQTNDQIYIETYWRYRFPFEDEINLGVADAETRFIINARPRKRSYLSSSDLWVVQFQGENQVRLGNSDAWVNAPMTNMAMSYFNKFADDLKIEFYTGLRKF